MAEPDFDYQGDDIRDLGTTTIATPVRDRPAIARSEFTLGGDVPGRKYCKQQHCDGTLNLYGGPTPRWVCAVCGTMDEDLTIQAQQDENAAREKQQQQMLEDGRRARTAQAEHHAHIAAMKEAEANNMQTIVDRLRKEADEAMKEAVKQGFQPPAKKKK